MTLRKLIYFWRKKRMNFPMIPVPDKIMDEWPKLCVSNLPKNDQYIKNVFQHFSILD